MPLISGTTTIGAGATQISTTHASIANFNLTAPAGAITIGKSDVATGGAISIAGNTNYSFGGNAIVFDLTELWVTGTNGQVVKWVAVAH